MQRVNNASEFKQLYPYKSPPNPEPCPPLKEYPKGYPCFCRVVTEGGGICGEYRRVEIIYPPKWVCLPSFLAGLNAMEANEG